MANRYPLPKITRRSGLPIVIARAVGPKQSREDKERLLRGVYPERSRRARDDTGESQKSLGKMNRAGLHLKPGPVLGCETFPGG